MATATHPTKKTAGNPQGPAALLTATQAAKYLGVGRTSFYRLRASGVLPKPVRVGEMPRYRSADLTRYVDRLRTYHPSAGEAEPSGDGK